MDINIILEKAGGAARLGAMVGVARTTVLDWKRTGLIPGNRVAQISAALNLPVKDVLALVQPGNRSRQRWPMDIDIILAKAGGAARLAAMVGVARTTVLDWKRTGLIPGNRVAQISEALNLPVKDVLALVQPGKTRQDEAA